MTSGLKLSEYITANRIIFKDKVENREELIAELLQCICSEDSAVCSHQESLYKKILEREELRSTAMGREVAIPHGRSAEISDIYIAFAHVKEELKWSPTEDVGVRYVFLVVGPAKEKAHEYLQLLAQISKLISRRNTREDLENADSPETVVRIIKGLKERKKNMPPLPS